MSLARFIGIWCLLAVLMSANGIFRETALKPAFGARPADVLSAMLGIAIILITTRVGFRFPTHPSTAHLALVSFGLIALTVAFELVFGHYVDRKSWNELAANYAVWRGRLWPFVLLSLAVSPFLWGRWVAPGSRMP